MVILHIAFGPPAPGREGMCRVQTSLHAGHAPERFGNRSITRRRFPRIKIPRRPVCKSPTVIKRRHQQSALRRNDLHQRLDYRPRPTVHPTKAVERRMHNHTRADRQPQLTQPSDYIFFFYTRCQFYLIPPFFISVQAVRKITCTTDACLINLRKVSKPSIPASAHSAKPGRARRRTPRRSIPSRID